MTRNEGGHHPKPDSCAGGDGARGEVFGAYAVHLLTALGIVPMLLAAMEIARSAPRPAWVFFWLAVALVIDSIDGPLARRAQVKRWAAAIDGRKIDDLVDYLGFTFIPLVLVWRMDWLPGEPELSWLWIAPALVTSLFGFAHAGAKDESGGFFRGFPSYWNVCAFYFGLFAAALPAAGPWINATMLLVLAALTVAPIWLVYPNLAPPPWRWPILGGAILWLVVTLAMLPFYPNRVPGWLTLVLLLYPLFYFAISFHLSRKRPSQATTSAPPSSDA
jgi:phosphatidylcholine synthase